VREAVIGFDARSPQPADWPAERRRVYLLKDVAEPLSIAELADAQRRWAAQLNEHHLFSSTEIAFAFRDWEIIPA